MIFRKQFVSQSGRAMRRAVVGLLVASMLGACAGLGAHPTGETTAPVPTVFSAFLLGTQGGSGDQPIGLPGVSNLFSQQTPAPTPTALGTPSPVITSTGTITSTSPVGEGGSGSPAGPSTPETGSAGLPPTGQSITGTIITSLPDSRRLPVVEGTTDALANAPEYQYTYIFRDFLSPGWKAWDSWNVYYGLGERHFVHRGKFSVVVSPVQDYAGMFFSVSDLSPTEYLKKDIVGVSFWINPGIKPLFPDDLAVTILGSNKYPYWVKDDNSVEVDNETTFFSETRLSLLGYKNKLEPNTWYQVLIWLDDLPFDPDYTYLTGFYIKNDVGVRNTFYLDDISLVTYSGKH